MSTECTVSAIPANQAESKLVDNQRTALRNAIAVGESELDNGLGTSYDAQGFSSLGERIKADGRQRAAK